MLQQGQLSSFRFRSDSATSYRVLFCSSPLLTYTEKRVAGHTMGCGDGVFDGDVQGTSFG